MDNVHTFSMAPIDALFQTQGDAAEFFEVDVRRYRRWQEKGVDWDRADRLAGMLKLHPSSIWGDQWWEAADADYGKTLFDGPDAPEEPKRKPAEPDWEMIARARKVKKLVTALRDRGCTPKGAESMDEDDRRQVAIEAGCNKPSDKTWALVLEEFGKLVSA